MIRHRFTLLVAIVVAAPTAAIPVAASISPEAQAAKGKKKSAPSYYGSFRASGQWQVSHTCGEHSFTSSWQMEGLTAKSALEPAGELQMTTGGASGRIDWKVDSLCNGNVMTGNCSVGLDEFLLPFFLDKVKGGLRVDFQLSLAVFGCGTAQVNAYGGGFLVLNRVTREPQAFIPNKKIGKKVITVKISGNDSGSDTAAGRSFSGQMEGTLKLTRKKQLQTLPD